MSPEEIVEKLSEFKALDPSCRKVYCSTCGGLSHAIDININAKLSSELKELYERHPNIESLVPEEWADYFRRNRIRYS